MIILNSSDKRLIGTLSSSPSVNPDYIVQYADIAGPSNVGTFDGLGQSEGEMSGSGIYTFLDSPSGSLIRRDVKYIKVHNSDTVDIDFKLSLTSSKGEFTIFDGTINDKYTLFYDNDGIIRLVDNFGCEVIQTKAATTDSASYALTASYFDGELPTSETASYVKFENVDFFNNTGSGDAYLSGSLTIDNYIDFVPSDNGVSHKEGRVYYDVNHHALSYYTEEPDVTMNIGQELWFRGVNKTGATLLDGTVVYISGSQGNRPVVWPADADFNSARDTIGVVTHDIEDNTEGYITEFGLVNGINLSSFTEGDVLYLSGSAGEFTNIEPIFPEVQHKVRIGYVTNASVNGQLLVKVEEFEDFSELYDTKFNNIQEGDVVVYSGSYGWFNSPTVPTASYVSWSNVDAKPFDLVNQLDCDLGIDVVDQFETSSGRSAEWLVNVYSGSSMRTSKIMACWLGPEARFQEFSTTDIGNTKKIDFDVDVSASFVRLLCDNTDSNNWQIKTLRTII
jgi:hypothetical protein